MKERTKLFSSDDFEKRLNVGDELIFDKEGLNQIRVDLTWAGTDLDVCAFLLDKEGLMSEREDLVYFKSKLRWQPEKSFEDPDFFPLPGKFTRFETSGYGNPRPWEEATLPVSGDGSVIGSWDDKGDETDERTDEEGNPLRGEQMHIFLDKVNVKKHKSIVLAAVVAKDRIQKGETFLDAFNPVVTIVDVSKEKEPKEIAEYRLDESFPNKDAVCFGRLEYDENSYLWNFVPMAESYNGGMQYLAREVYN